MPEHSVLIDSKDRDYRVFPDPFSYTVTFNSRSYRGVPDAPAPRVHGTLRQVIAIRLAEVVLPIYNLVRIEESNLLVNTYKPLTNNLYITVHLEGWVSQGAENCYSTNELFSTCFAVIYPGPKANHTHYYGRVVNGCAVFTTPIDLKKLKVSFYMPEGAPIQVTHLEPSIDSGLECNCEDPEGDDGTDCYRHNIRHPLNPIFQHHLHLRIETL